MTRKKPIRYKKGKKKHQKGDGYRPEERPTKPQPVKPPYYIGF